MANASVFKNYEIWKTPWGNVAHVPYVYPSAWKFERDDWNPYYFFGAFNMYWHYSLYIVAFYVVTVHMLEYWMRNRKPMDLKLPLFFWNSALAIFSIIGTMRFGQECLHVLWNRPLFDSICFAVDPQQPAGFWALLFALSKVFELVDTVFIVLRKRPLIFLHWYHHSVVLVYTITLTAPGRYFMTINYFVHSLMYTYYAISACGIRVPRLVAMTVTSLQTLQMFIGISISIVIASLKFYSSFHKTELVCQQSNSNLALCFFIYFTFAVLFMKFFNKAYLKSNNKEDRPLIKENRDANMNGHVNDQKNLMNNKINGLSKAPTPRKDKYA